MKKEIITNVVSGAVGALLIVIAGWGYGYFQKGMSATEREVTVK